MGHMCLPGRDRLHPPVSSHGLWLQNSLPQHEQGHLRPVLFAHLLCVLQGFGTPGSSQLVSHPHPNPSEN